MNLALLNNQQDDQVVAFMDIGTNSVRMLLARILPDRTYIILNRRKETIRLGENEFQVERLQPAAMDRAVLVCHQLAEMAKANGAKEIIAVATAATREARNQAEFLRRLKREDLLDVQVVSGMEEARLIYLGVSRGMHLSNHRAVFIDIGGGSTETIVGGQDEYQYLDSLKLGAIRLSLMFLKGETGPVPEEVYELICSYVRDTAIRTIQAIRLFSTDFVVGSSGTIENLADIASYMFNHRRRNPDDVMNTRQLKRVVKALCSATLEERRKLPGINPERADIIIGGAAILETLLQDIGLEEIRISERGLQDGLLVDYLNRLEGSLPIPQASVREAGVLRLGRALNFDESHARKVTQLALELFDSAKQAGLHSLSKEERELLEYAAMLHDIGIALSYSNHHDHSYYIIRNAELPGFNQVDIGIIANTALFHRKAYPRKKQFEFRELDKRSQEVVKILCVFLSIAESLDRSHMGKVEHVQLETQNRKKAILEIQEKTDSPLELWGVEYHKEAFERLFKRKLELLVR